MNWKETVKDYLTFTAKERLAILLLVASVIITFSMPSWFTAGDVATQDINDTGWLVAMDQLGKRNSPDSQNNNENETSSYFYDRTAPEKYSSLFYFDPNTINEDGWKALGLREKTIQTLLKYRNKGGRFKKPEDLQRIYGLRQNEFERLSPFIRFPSAEKSDEIPGKPFIAQEVSQKTEHGVMSSFDINSASIADFINLPGIGEKLATRIVNFRDKLGGFYSISQVGETFGLHDSTFQKIKPFLVVNDHDARKININLATLDELKAHPYIKWNIANTIVAYRSEHGSFSKMEDLKKLMVITDELYSRISNYLTIQ